MLYQHLIETQKLTSQDKLPPVLPIVIYNGIPQWNAARDVSELIEKIPGFKQYRPHLYYFLIDEGCYTDSQLEPLNNLVAALIKLEKTPIKGGEQAIAQKIGQVLAWLLERLKDDKRFLLRRDWVTWLKRVLLPRKVPNIQIPEMIELQEVKAMLYENIQAWYEEARQSGITEGEEKGVIKGKAEALIELLEEQFGHVDEQTRSLIYQLDEDNLRVCFKRSLSAKSVSDVIRPFVC